MILGETAIRTMLVAELGGNGGDDKVLYCLEVVTVDYVWDAFGSV
jgi:hypothetical protein